MCTTKEEADEEGCYLFNGSCLSLDLLIACGSTAVTEPQQESKSTTEQTEPQSESSNVLTSGVFIDLDSVNDPILNDDIKTLLKNTLDSLANKNEN
ncbi:hypothetical protein J2W91_004727 [Paenibacillus amylolyticus]|uniref:Uncharacterized protein n=1 Tax=Paenibacillus amylolyticus TaxID=1451 RepID=A0AAP5H704_PAEAM|nr:hypothetical protein [Paenibacillus amylolyticus]